MAECPYCGDDYFAIDIHRMRCVAEQVAEEQAKSLKGVADEIEAQSPDGEYEDVVEQLRWMADAHQEELSETLQEEVPTVDS